MTTDRAMDMKERLRALAGGSNTPEILAQRFGLTVSSVKSVLGIAEPELPKPRLRGRKK